MNEKVSYKDANKTLSVILHVDTLTMSKVRKALAMDWMAWLMDLI